MKILLINDTRHLTNWGCVGTTTGLLEEIDQEGIDIKTIELKKMTKHYRYKNILADIFHRNARILFKRKKIDYNKIAEKLGAVKAIPEISTEFESIATNWLNNKEFEREIEKLKWADFILVNGEGSIYGREAKGFYLMFLAWFCREKLDLNTPMCMVNCTIQIDDHRSLTNGMARKTFDYFDEIFVREPISKKRVEELDLYSGEVKCFPDIVFRHDIPSKNDLKLKKLSFEIEKPFIIIGDSSHTTRDSIFKTETFKETVVEFIERMDEEFPNHQIVLSCCPEGLPGFDKIDYPKISAKDVSYSDYIYICSKADLHISGRHHGSLYAMIGDCPFLMMSANTYKTEGDARLVDWPFKTYDLTNLKYNMSDIIEDSKTIINKRKKYVDYLKEKKKDFEKKCLNHVNVVKKYQ